MDADPANDLGLLRATLRNTRILAAVLLVALAIAVYVRATHECPKLFWTPEKVDELTLKIYEDVVPRPPGGNDSPAVQQHLQRFISWQDPIYAYFIQHQRGSSNLCEAAGWSKPLE